MNKTNVLIEQKYTHKDLMTFFHEFDYILRIDY